MRIIFTLLILSLNLALAPLRAGELDPAQQEWFKKYEKQENVPQPAAMLLNTDPEPKLGAGAKPLFNGKDLSGWKSRGGESKFDVVDGCIRAVCKPDTASTYLCTEREDYGDFLLSGETRFVTETNTGIMIRAQADGKDRNNVFGPQVEMEPYTQGRGWSGGIYGQSCGGWFYPVWLKEHAEARKAQHLKKADEWNRITILAQGDVIKTWQNGVPVANWKGDKYPKGYIGLQMHKGKKGEVLWRDLKVEELGAK